MSNLLHSRRCWGHCPSWLHFWMEGWTMRTGQTRVGMSGLTGTSTMSALLLLSGLVSSSVADTEFSVFWGMFLILFGLASIFSKEISQGLRTSWTQRAGWGSWRPPSPLSPHLSSTPGPFGWGQWLRRIHWWQHLSGWILNVVSSVFHLILLFGTDWSLDTSLFWKVKYLNLNVQCLRSFSVSKQPFQVSLKSLVSL